MRFSLRTLLVVVLFTASIALVLFQRVEIQKLDTKLDQYKAIVSPDTLIAQEMRGNIEYRLSSNGNHQFFIRFPGKTVQAGPMPRTTQSIMSVSGLGKFVWGNDDGLLKIEACDLPGEHTESLKLFRKQWDELEFEILCREYTGSLERPIELFRIRDKGGGTESIYLYTK